MQPSIARRMLPLINSFIALAMIFECPGARPEIRVVGCQHASLAAGGHDFVLTEREGIDMTHRPHGTPLVTGAMRLRAVFDDLQLMLASKLEDWVHIARPSCEVDRDDGASAGAKHC